MADRAGNQRVVAFQADHGSRLAERSGRRLGRVGGCPDRSLSRLALRPGGARRTRGAARLTLDERARHLREGTLQRWVRKGTAWRFEHQSRPASLIEIAAQALAEARPAARLRWLTRLQGLDVSCITSIVTMVPGLSDVAASFAVEVMCANRGRLLDDC